MLMRLDVRVLIVILGVVLPVSPAWASPVTEVSRQPALLANGSIVIEGTGIRVRGDVHANGDVLILGNAQIEGTVSASGRVQVVPQARAARTVPGAPRVAVPAVNLATYRSQATRVINGSQRFSGATIFRGVTYATDSVVIDGLVGGDGTVVAEREILYRGSQIPVAGRLDLIAGQRILVQGPRLDRARMFTPGTVELSGENMRLTVTAYAGQVHVRGRNIDITALGESTGGIVFPQALRPAPPTIIDPPPGAFYRGAGRIMVVGQAPPGARVRLTLRHVQSWRETVVEVTASETGRYAGFLDVPLFADFGDYLVRAEVIGPGGIASEPTTVAIRIGDFP